MSQSAKLDATEKALFDAIDAGDRDTVRKMVEAQPALVGLHSSRSFGSTVVNAAVSARNLDMVDLLIELGADINAGSDWWAGSWRPIHSCINPARDELAAALVERGAEIDVHAAAGLGDLNRLAALLDEDPALVNARGGDGCAPLHFARSPATAALLLSRGADVDLRDVDHESTALQWSLESRPEVGTYLADRGAANDVFFITRLDDVERLRVFLDAHPESLMHRTGKGAFATRHSDALHHYGYTLGDDATPLHAAGVFDSPAAARILLERGLATDVRGVYDQASPLHWAAWHDAPRTAGVLLEAGADPDLRSGPQQNSTALSWAIVGGAPAAVDVLVDGGATVTAEHRSQAETGAAGGYTGYRPGRALDDWRKIAERLGVG